MDDLNETPKDIAKLLKGRRRYRDKRDNGTEDVRSKQLAVSKVRRNLLAESDSDARLILA